MRIDSDTFAFTPDYIKQNILKTIKTDVESGSISIPTGTSVEIIQNFTFECKFIIIFNNLDLTNLKKNNK